MCGGKGINSSRFQACLCPDTPPPALKSRTWRPAPLSPYKPKAAVADICKGPSSPDSLGWACAGRPSSTPGGSAPGKLSSRGRLLGRGHALQPRLSPRTSLAAVSWLRRSGFGNKALTKRGVSVRHAAPQRPGCSSPRQGPGRQGGEHRFPWLQAGVALVCVLRAHLFSSPVFPVHNAPNDLNAFVHLLMQLTVPEQPAALDQVWGRVGEELDMGTRVLPRRLRQIAYNNS